MEVYQQEKTALLKQLHVNPKKGLSATQVTDHREKWGENKLPEKKEAPYWKVFLKNFKEPIVIVLMGAIVLSLLSAFYDIQVQGHVKSGRESLYEAAAIFILIVINAF